MGNKIITIIFGSKRSSISFILPSTVLMIFTVCNLVAAFDAPTTNSSTSRSHPAFAQSGGNFNMTSSVIAGGGGKSTGGPTTLEGTIGQPILGAASGGNFTVNGGFWQSSPTSTVSISGLISYCAAATPPGVPNATLNLTGDMMASVMTNGTGNYSFTDLPGGGSYVVTPTKVGAVSGISTADASRTLQSLAGTLTLTACQTIAADTSANGTVSTADATHILNFLAGNPPVATNHTGEWRFTPTSRTYTAILSDQTAQNYDAYLLGDNSGNWTPAGPTPQAAQLEPGGAAITVTLPTASVGVNVTNFSLPIVVDTTTGQGVTGYRIRVVFNSTVVGLQATAITTTGTLSNGWFTAVNTTTPGVLIVTAANATPLSGAGTLLIINFTRQGAQGTSTALQFQTSGSFPGLQFEDANESIVPTVGVNGAISIGAAPTIARLNEFTANSYNSGTQLRWQTAYESQNLGFNLYREIDGKRELVNKRLVAGSALRASLTAPVAAGEGYTWWDNKPTKNAAYWLEDIDLKGMSTWHGPFYAREVGGEPPARSNALLLSQKGQLQSAATTTRVVETVAALPRLPMALSGEQAKLQGGPANVKITVKREGWYRVTQPELAAVGLPNKVDASKLQLFADGQEIPIAVATNKKGKFDGNSFIEFYGLGLDTPSSDARVYWLAYGNQTGKRIGKVASEGVASSAKSFTQTVERRDRTIYFSSLRNGERENFFGAVISADGLDQTLTLRHLAQEVSQPATLQISLQGVTLSAHRVAVHLNGNNLGFVDFNGQENRSAEFSMPQSLLNEENTVRLIPQNGSGDISLVDSIRLSYQHTFNAVDDRLKLTANGGEQVKVSGFVSKMIRVFDVTDANNVIELLGEIAGQQDGSFTVTVASPEKGTRNLLALVDEREPRPVSIKANRESTWRDGNNGADLVILTSRDFFPALKPLKALREREGLQVALVDIEDLYDEFSFGNKTPQTVKDFLLYASTNWRIKPRFVLFAADASFDARNYLGFGDHDIVPTKLIDTALLETASDDWLADFNADGIADLSIGRLPVRSVEEAINMVGKLVRYASATPATSALLVSDANDEFDFEQSSTELRSLLESRFRVEELQRGQLEPEVAKARLLDAFRSGQSFINYIGHGSVDLWRGNLLTSEEARDLTNQSLPIMVMMTCMNGYFHDAVLDSLSESLLKAERGGAIAAWTSSGMTTPQEQTVMNRELYRVLFGASGRDLRLGEAILKAKQSIGDPDIRRTWVLLGDPTMRLQ